MGITTMYQTYYGIQLDHYSSEWAGTTYDKILIKDFPNEYCSSTSYTNSNDVTFLFPSLYKNIYYLDGLAEGHISIYNEDPATARDVTDFTVTLKKSPDVEGTETVLGSYNKSISTNNSVPAEDYLTLPVFIDISHQKVEENEKLLMRVQFTSSSASLSVAHFNDSSVIDMQIKLPYAPTG